MNSAKSIIVEIIISIAVIGYSVYTIAIGGDYVANSNEVLKTTKLGAVYESITKESISFNPNVVNFFTNTKDFTKEVPALGSSGRDNPFLP